MSAVAKGHWSPADVATLRAAWPTMEPLDDLAARLRRPRDKVVDKARGLGLMANGRRWDMAQPAAPRQPAPPFVPAGPLPLEAQAMLVIAWLRGALPVDAALARLGLEEEMQLTLLADRLAWEAVR